MDEAEFARLDRVRWMGVRDFDPGTGSAYVTFSFTGDDPYGSTGCVRMDLDTGELLPGTEWQPSELGTLRSPCGEMIMRESDSGCEVTIEDADGSLLAELDHPDISDVKWMPDSSGVLYTVRAGLHLLDLDSGSSRLLMGESVRDTEWSPDNRLLAFKIAPTNVPDGLSRNQHSQSGTLVILDAERDFEQITSFGYLLQTWEIGDEGRKVAYTELVEDEYGDYDSYALRVFDIESGQVTEILTERRDPRYAWAGDSLAVVTSDRYAVPTLSLYSLHGTHIELITMPGASDIRPQVYLADRGKLIYTIALRDGLEYHEELRSIRPGSAPERLLPRNRR